MDKIEDIKSPGWGNPKVVIAIHNNQAHVPGVGDFDELTNFSEELENEHIIDKHRPKELGNFDNWIIMKPELLLLKYDKHSSTYTLPFGPISPIKYTQEKFGLLHNITIPGENKPMAKAFRIDSLVDLEGYQWVGLRSSYDVLTKRQYTAATKAVQMIYWDMDYKFCSNCGTPLDYKDYNLKECPSCGKMFFPKIAPAMIVRIDKGDKIFLVKAKNFRRKSFFGLTAGFMEVGETLEECVEREVFEETHMKVKNIKYFGSQSWPYPGNLMVGFTAEYESGEVVLQEEELSSGEFFGYDELPPVPKRLSMARKLIDDWIKRRKK